ncbi:MAG: hypothetical protein ACLVIU_05140, partial [Paraclostridium sp.]
MKKFVSKNDKNTLAKKISIAFIIAVLIQFIFIFFTMIILGFWPVSALTIAVYLSIISIICYSYIYKKIEEKIDYIE